MTNDEYDEYDRKEKNRRIDKYERMNKMISILKENGVEMHVSACGCCSSPWIRFFKYKGETIINEFDDCSFNTEKNYYVNMLENLKKE